LRRSDWVIFAKRPFAGPQAVLAYLSRYTHRVAISNSRLLALDEAGVTFKWKDYRIKGRDRLKTMTLDTAEFIRRFLLHVLPSGFHRIRHYGLFAGTARARNIERARQLLAPSTTPSERSRAEADSDAETASPARQCPCCGEARSRSSYERSRRAQRQFAGWRRGRWRAGAPEDRMAHRGRLLLLDRFAIQLNADDRKRTRRRAPLRRPFAQSPTPGRAQRIRPDESRRERRAEARRWRRQRSRALPSPDAAGRWLAGFHDAGEEARRQAGRAFIPAASRGVAGLWRVNGELLRTARALPSGGVGDARHRRYADRDHAVGLAAPAPRASRADTFEAPHACLRAES
jgi:Putative transposase